MQIPTEPKNWEEIPAWAAQVTRLLRAFYPRPSVDLMPSVGAGGTTSRVRNRGPSPQAATVYDFTLIPVKLDGAANITLIWGFLTVNGIALDTGVNPWPEEFDAGNTPPWSDTKPCPGGAGELWYAYIIVTVNLDPAGDGSMPPVVDSISWDLFTEAQTNSTDGTTGYLFLGAGTVSEDGSSSTVLNQQGIGDQVLTWCGGLFYFFPAAYSAQVPD